MMLTENKAKMISEFLMADKERGQKLLEMAPKDAANVMNAAGCDVTIDELIEFGSAMAQTPNKEELSETDLDNVAGGLGLIATYAIACAAVFAVGVVVGRVEKW